MVSVLSIELRLIHALHHHQQHVASGVKAHGTFIQIVAGYLSHQSVECVLQVQ